MERLNPTYADKEYREEWIQGSAIATNCRHRPQPQPSFSFPPADRLRCLYPFLFSYP